MKYRPKISLIPIILHRRYSSSSSKKNHYDNLNIETNATHNEVKSAYFELSKLYHPDMNSSDEAKEKFRVISEAYEILGNHEKRKQYDRGLRISNPSFSTGDYPYYDIRQQRNMTPEELQKAAERVQAAYARQEVEGIPVYDFDRWTKDHYGKVFRETLKKKRKIKELLKEKEAFQKAKTGRQTGEYFGLLLLVMTFATLIMVQNQVSNSDPPCPVNVEKRSGSETSRVKDSIDDRRIT